MPFPLAAETPIIGTEVFQTGKTELEKLEFSILSNLLFIMVNLFLKSDFSENLLIKLSRIPSRLLKSFGKVVASTTNKM